MRIRFYHGPVETIKSLDEDIHDLRRNFANIRVLKSRNLVSDKVRKASCQRTTRFTV